MSSKESCECTSCQNACTYNPGWFLPGEAENTAALLGIPLREYFDRYVGVNWFNSAGGEPIFVLAPAITDMEPGNEYPGDPRGRCVHFEGGKCTIHAAKPYECREFLHTDSAGEPAARHKVVAAAWRGHQHQIVFLCGRIPKAHEFS